MADIQTSMSVRAIHAVKSVPTFMDPTSATAAEATNWVMWMDLRVKVGILNQNRFEFFKVWI